MKKILLCLPAISALYLIVYYSKVTDQVTSDTKEPINTAIDNKDPTETNKLKSDIPKPNDRKSDTLSDEIASDPFRINELLSTRFLADEDAFFGWARNLFNDKRLSDRSKSYILQWLGKNARNNPKSLIETKNFLRLAIADSGIETRTEALRQMSKEIDIETAKHHAVANINTGKFEEIPLLHILTRLKIDGADTLVNKLIKSGSPSEIMVSLNYIKKTRSISEESVHELSKIIENKRGSSDLRKSASLILSEVAKKEPRLFGIKWSTPSEPIKENWEEQKGIPLKEWPQDGVIEKLALQEYKVLEGQVNNNNSRYGLAFYNDRLVIGFIIFKNKSFKQIEDELNNSTTTLKKENSDRSTTRRNLYVSIYHRKSDDIHYVIYHPDDGCPYFK